MDAEAWGANHHVVDHVLATGVSCEIAGNADGAVSVKFRVAEPLGIKGEYFFRLKFTVSEINEIHRKSLVSEAKGNPAQTKIERRI
jgi:hypothetical protein